MWIFIKCKKYDIFIISFFSNFTFFRQLNVKKVLVSGGCLDHRVVPQILNEGGGEKLSVLALDEAGRVRAFSSTTVNAFHPVI